MSKKIFIALLGLVLVAGVFSPGVLAAEKYSIKQMTPEVKSALDARRGRYGQLQALKEQGKVGENNSGYVTAFSDESGVRGLVNAENADRRTIYRTIAEQNNLTGAMNTIEKVFAQTQRDKARPGDKIQLENGNWVNK